MSEHILSKDRRSPNFNYLIWRFKQLFCLQPYLVTCVTHGWVTGILSFLGVFLCLLCQNIVSGPKCVSRLVEIS